MANAMSQSVRKELQSSLRCATPTAEMKMPVYGFWASDFVFKKLAKAILRSEIPQATPARIGEAAAKYIREQVAVRRIAPPLEQLQATKKIQLQSPAELAKATQGNAQLNAAAPEKVAALDHPLAAIAHRSALPVLLLAAPTLRESDRSALTGAAIHSALDLMAIDADTLAARLGITGAAARTLRLRAIGIEVG